ncbi:hypothetical protein ACWDAZ_25795 [Streptomyces sp. NPDC001215]
MEGPGDLGDAGRQFADVGRVHHVVVVAGHRHPVDMAMGERLPGDRVDVGTPGGRGRRVSCTVALAVAGALAVATLGSHFVFRLFDGGGSGDNTAGGAPRSPSATSSASAPASGNAAVPAFYLGTWEGDALALGGALPAGRFRLTIGQAAAGGRIGTFRSTDQIGGVCDDVLILKRATAGQLVATSVAEESNPSQCTTGSHEVQLTPTGSDLRYETDNADAGNPTALLQKVK